MFSQAGQAIRDHPDVVLGGLAAGALIAVGESQSAGRLVTYIDAVHPLVRRLRRLLRVQPWRGRCGAVAGAAASGDARRRPPSSATTSTCRCWSSRPRPTPAACWRARRTAPIYRLWEVAGTAHFDQYGLSTGRNDVGERGSVAEWFDSCCTRPTSRARASPAPRRSTPGPQTFVLRSAMANLNRWVADGTPPRRRHVWRRSASSRSSTPWTPTATCSAASAPRRSTPRWPRSAASGRAGTQFCGLFGTTAPFTAEQLAALYGSHGGFVVGVEPGHPVRGAIRVHPARRRPTAARRRRSVLDPQVGHCSRTRSYMRPIGFLADTETDG